MSSAVIQASEEYLDTENISVVTQNITVSERKILTYDGSHLGSFDFTTVSWWKPCVGGSSSRKSVPFYACINLPGLIEPQYVILKRNCAGNTDQFLIDELKSIFGLHKMGTHGIRLRGIPRRFNNDYQWITDTGIVNAYIEYERWSEYFLFRAVTKRDSEGKITVIPLNTLKDTEWLPNVTTDIKEGHKKFFYEVQKILVYRELVRVGTQNLDDILVKMIDSKFFPLSIDEMSIKSPTSTPKKLPSNVEKFFFPYSSTRMTVLIKMLGLTHDNYRIQIGILCNSMSNIINRVDPTLIWLVNDVSARLINKCTLHYEHTEHTEDS